ncbi:unnamed protein product [Sphenostylis stenocarpa]|uniref:Uncharacterized protein n=1 Tax=Sphenostylis stenocarpa TaxID=92480 RepID=A0AA86SN72_9FABA|nr:unnamed protein product [Sphenostylis stenocarpa]
MDREGLKFQLEGGSARKAESHGRSAVFLGLDMMDSLNLTVSWSRLKLTKFIDCICQKAVWPEGHLHLPVEKGCESAWRNAFAKL